MLEHEGADLLLLVRDALSPTRERGANEVAHCLMSSVWNPDRCQLVCAQ